MTYTEKLYFVELISITKEENGTVWKATSTLKENSAPLIFLYVFITEDPLCAGQKNVKSIF